MPLARDEHDWQDDGGPGKSQVRRDLATVGDYTELRRLGDASGQLAGALRGELEPKVEAPPGRDRQLLPCRTVRNCGETSRGFSRTVRRMARRRLPSERVV